MFREKRVGLTFLMTVVSVLSIVVSLPVEARDNAQQTVNGASDKLVRGVVNVATGWMEFPKNIVTCTAQTRSVTGPFRGIFRGIGMIFVRTGAGVIEVVSFVDPKPGHYDGILDPPTIFERSEKASEKQPSERQPDEQPSECQRAGQSCADCEHKEQPCADCQHREQPLSDSQPQEKPQAQPEELPPQKEMVAR